MAEQKPWPTEIRLDRDKRVLTVTFDAGGAHAFDAEFLRVFSPSAEVQGHSPDQRRLIVGKRGIKILKVDPVGNYAVRLTFEDGHNTGIFTWDYFARLAAEKESRWATYLGELAEKGFSREPSRRT